jgi:hypothetical protein
MMIVGSNYTLGIDGVEDEAVDNSSCPALGVTSKL